MLVSKLKIKSIPYTYILEWTSQNKRYIGARWAAGCHPSDLWNEYFTSSKYVGEFVKKYGAPDIILIDQTFEFSQDAMKREQELQIKFNVVKNTDFINKGIAGIWDNSDPDVREKMRKSRIGKKQTEEHKRKIGIASKNVVRSKEWGRRISEGNKGRKLSQGHIEKIIDRLKGNNYRRGTKTSEQGRINIGLAHIGKTRSIETKKLMSEQRIGKKQRIVKCYHCEVSGGAATMPRWHFDNCKYKTGE